MKLKLTLCLLVIKLAYFAQSPELINYQGIARDLNGSPIIGTVGLKFELRQGSASSPTVFSEVQSVTTSSLGLFSTQIGKTAGNLNGINWQSGSLFLEVSLSMAGGSYTSLGVQQLVSVPYALHAQTVPSTYSNNVLTIGSGPGAGTYTLSPPLSAPATSITSSGGGGTVSSTGTNTFNLYIPSTTLTAGQNISVQGAHPEYTISSTPSLGISGNNLFISGGNTVTLPGTGVVSTSVVSSGAAAITTLGTNSFSIDVPVPTFTNTGQNIITGSYPNFTVNTPTVPAASGPTLVASGAAVNTTVAPNSYSIHVPPVGIALTATGTAQSVGSTGMNSVSINIPTVSVSQGTGGISVTGAYPNYTVSGSSASPTITGTGAAVVSPLSGNSFTVNVPPLGVTVTSTANTMSVSPAGTNSVSINIPTVALSSGSNVVIGGSFPNYTVSATPTLDIIGNTLFISGGNSVTIPTSGTIAAINTTITSSGAAVTTLLGPNDYSIHVPVPSFTNSGPATITGAYPNFTLNSPAAVSYTNGAGISISSGSIINTAPDLPVSITDGGNVTVSGTYPNYTLSTPGASSYTNGTGISISSGSIINTAPDLPVSITDGGNITVSGTYPNYTLSTPGASSYTNGAGISISSGSIINTAPDLPVSITDGGNITVSGTYPNYTLSTPGASSYTNGAGISISSGSIINTAPDLPVSINNGGNITITGSYPNYTLAAPASPTITGSGLAVVSPSTGALINVNVPPLSYTSASGALGSGSNTVNISQPLSLTGNTLVSGAASNSVDLSNLTPFTAIGNSVVQTTLSNLVGIGTNGPVAKLDIAETSTYTGVYLNVQNLNATNGSNMVDLYSNGSGYAMNVVNSNSSPSVPAAMIDGGLRLRGKTANNSAYALQASDVSGTDLFVVNNDGSTGIGISNPLAKLHVVNTTAAAQGMNLEINNPSNSTIGFQIRHFGNGHALYSEISNSSSPANALNTISNSDNENTFRAASTSALTGIYAGMFEGGLVTRGKNSLNTGYAFRAQESAGNDLMVVRNDGHIGIGLATPTAVLTLSNTSMDETSYFNLNNSGSSAHAFVASSNSNNQFAMRVLNTSAVLTAYAGMFEGGLVARGKNNTTTGYTFKAQEIGGSDLFTIRNDGYISVRSNSPAYDLSIFNSGNSAGIQLKNSVSAGLGLVISQNNIATNFLSYDNIPMFFGTNTINRMVLTAAGNLGIGNMSPTATLDVAGTVKIADGSQGSGKVLTSDAAGNASWMPGIPSGAVMAYAGSTVPAGWTKCDGTALNRTTYASLFAAIGTSWGVGDGSTTFNVPDMRGMFLRGVDETAGNDPDKAGRTTVNGGNTGNAVGSRQTDAFESHTHSISTLGDNSTALGLGLGSTLYSNSGTKTTNSSGGSTETRPKNVNVYYIIKQ